MTDNKLHIGKGCCLILLIIFIATPLHAQKVDLTQVWPTKWIMTKDGPAKEYAVHHFRKIFQLDSIPDSLIVHTSGDNRYQLYVNEQLATWGPLRGDLRHWYYESTNISPYLKRGKNVIAVVVLNYGSHPPDAQLTVQTGFLLTADDQQFRMLNTNESWKAIHNQAYSPSLVDKSQVNGYYGAGSKEMVDGNKYIWGWNKLEFDDSKWQAAIVIENAYAKTCKWASRWKLTPRQIPHEILTPERFTKVRITDNIKIPKGFPTKAGRIEIPMNFKGSFVLDHGHLTTAYPVLSISGGENAKITFTYVEAPYIGNPKNKQKGNRDEVEGKNFIGVFDQFIADGGENRIYQPLWWRAFRYIEVYIETEDDPLIIHDISSIRSKFPFQQKATIKTNDEENDFMNQLMEIGHRTMMACSHEHFMDCPYYEESQFEGDTREEALVSYFNYGDPSLGKNAIEQFSWSINDEGFLSARYPTNTLYYIPNFSIYWIGMLYDYMMIYDDPDFVRSKMSIVRHVLNYFANHERADGTLNRLDYHQFVDWSFKAGEPPFDEHDYSAIVDLHYLLALQWAVSLEKEFGDPYFYNLYLEKAKKLQTSIHQLYWDDKLELYTDIPGSDEFLSQHTNSLAILCNVAPKEYHNSIMKKVLAKEDMTEATLYWYFYIFEALGLTDLGDQYLQQLDVWKEVIDLGVTTWPETGPASRSECHGWGSSPNYHLLKIVAGISSDGPGFKKIRIAPKPGKINKLEVEMPHHLGVIKVKIEQKDSGIQAEVEIPEGTEGVFVWGDQEKAFSSGNHIIEF